jgi:two-component system, OmpR family, response regulator
MPKIANIVIVDDDASIRDALSEYLRGHGYMVRVASDSSEMDQLLGQSPADLVILDWMMPGEDGLSVCRRLAASGQAILMLSALGSSPDRIVGLEVGADDYLSKPFDPRELLARTRALLRRKSGQAAETSSQFSFAGWRFRAEEQLLWDPGGDLVALTSLECKLLQAFAERSGRLLRRDTLIQLTRGLDVDVIDRAVDLSVSRLRRKLSRPKQAELIETVRGEGYRFCVPVSRL